MRDRREHWVGGESGIEALHHYTQLKSISVRL